MKNRYSQRVPVACSVIFAGDGGVGEGRILDISLPGCLLESAATLKTGDYVQLRLFLPELQSPLHVPLAAVRWVEGNRVGLEFIRTSREEQGRLERFFRRKSRVTGRKAAWTDPIVVVGVSGD
ncbi:MAG TPA: PilZ domain-containing protein [Nitrospiraceae bacterium]|nr:PilZ domain-containing protein [Nitrospiraceae bacterium]